MSNADRNDLQADLAELLRTLDRVITRLAAIQQTPRTYGTDVHLYSTEIHTIQAIGERADASLTRLAKHMGVTKGAISQTIAKLADKGLVIKTPAPQNAREIRVGLTDTGWTAHRNHEAFDRRILSAIEAHCGSETPRRVRLYLEVLRDLEAILQRFESASVEPRDASEEDEQ